MPNRGYVLLEGFILVKGIFENICIRRRERSFVNTSNTHWRGLREVIFVRGRNVTIIQALTKFPTKLLRFT